MDKTTSIRSGLWLVPWLPLFTVVAGAHTLFSPPVYVSRTILELDAHGRSMPPTPESPLAFHFTPLASMGLAVTLAFIAGIILLAVGLLARRRASLHF